MYPEASYSFDGTPTPLPSSLGKCVKLLEMPVIMIRTFGAFQHDPLYNNLQQRKVDVYAEIKYLFSPEQAKDYSVEEINQILKDQFTFDNWRWQVDNHIKVDEPFRADYLNRVLYKCPHCLKEGTMLGKGTKIRCQNCESEWELSEYGELISNSKETFRLVSSWYKWEREEVRKEIDEGKYQLDIEVNISALKGTKALYNIGKGVLHHDINGFHLVGCDGKLDFKVSPRAQYSLYSDYYWYEIGDMISIGDSEVTYYCFPIDQNVDVAAKTRIATEEIYKKLSQNK